MRDDIASMLSEDAKGDASPDALATATQMAEKQAALETAVETIEERLKEAKAELQHCKTVLVPDAMKKANQAEFRINDGLYAGVKVSLNDFVQGSLPKEEPARGAAIDVLAKNGAGALIRTEVVVSFTKTQHNEAIDLLEELKEREYSAAMQSSVHPQSLFAWARERLRNGEEVFAEKLGLFVGSATKLTWPKVTAPRKKKQ